ncbi:MAG: RnfABCDGE type electron transport complex subunit D [Zoogloeaceae bacterium]|nr:RnfABCDGE type electron transport complex subunit D [Rhodocyclaceae bacterium]MCP5235863.1 RnfABCDGE type electron transport complex subunit D [Zoogloeaceae bacterium]
MTAPQHSPHAHDGGSVGRVMAQVMLALTPVTLWGFYLFGWPAIWMWLITVGSAMLFELACLRLGGGGRATLGDGSAALAGWLLALTLPPWSPWWIAVIGSFVAICIAKHAYGGLGQNPFNPAMVARVALLISFPLEMTQWVAPAPMFSGLGPDPVAALERLLFSTPIPDALTSATLLGQVKAEASRGVDLLASLPALGAGVSDGVGHHAGSLGETGSWLILGGGLFLVYRGVIGWLVPVALVTGLAVPAAIAHAIDPAHHLSALHQVFAGAALLGAVFIATDPVSSPASAVGKLIYGLAIGFLTWVIRSFAGFPEGLAFAVLLMNACVPIIDRFTRPRIYGHGATAGRGA